jgi:DHA1 family multidrug resistance protein-like MFS transporter
MTSRHAAQWQIGLSWTMFAASFAAFSPVAGRLVDRVDRRHLAIVAMAATTGFLVIYPFLARPAWLIALGTMEAVGVAIALPAAQSLLSQLAPPSALGRAQGVFTTAENAAIAVAAGASGYLFALNRPLPFLVAAAVAAALTLLLPLLWRDVVGHAHDAPAVPEAGVPAQPGPVSSARHVGQGVADATAKA